MKAFVRPAVAFSTFYFLLSTFAFAQGSLTPPAAPAPTMKSLDQIEARTPISSAPYTINTPGSYYLTNNISVSSGNAITINTSNVSLDLNGFTISCTASSGSGNAILINGNILFGQQNLHISNGSIQGSGFGDAISGVAANNSIVSRISISGCSGSGILLGRGSGVVDSCMVQNVGEAGITAGVVTNSMASQCPLFGIEADVVENCYADTSDSSDSGLNATVALNSSGSNFSSALGGATGLVATVATGCVGLNTGTSAGLLAADAWNCRAQASGFNGTGPVLSATTAVSCLAIESNNTGQFTGISAKVADGCWSEAYTGMQTTLARNCFAVGLVKDGLDTNVADGCSARTNNGAAAISTAVAENCYAQGGNPQALKANCALTCYGTGPALGIQADVVNNCYGIGETEPGILVTTTVMNSFGQTPSAAAGLVSDNIAVGSYGSSTNGTGLVAFLGNSCWGDGGQQRISVAHFYNLP